MVTGQLMGWEGRLEYVEETSEGVPPTSVTLAWIGNVLDFTPKAKVETKSRYRMPPRGATSPRSPDSVAKGLETFGCKFSWNPQASSAIYDYMDFVTILLGSATGIGATKKTAMLNVVEKEGTSEGPMKGCVAKYFLAKCSKGQDVLFETEVEAGSWDPSAPLTVTSDLSGASDAYLQATEASGDVLDWSNVTITLSGTAQDAATDCEFRIDFGAKPRHRMHDSAPGEVLVGVAEITGKVTYDFIDTTELLRMKNKSSFALTVKIGDKTWSFTNCVWGEVAVPSKTDDPIVVDMPFTAEGVTVA